MVPKVERWDLLRTIWSPRERYPQHRLLMPLVPMLRLGFYACTPTSAAQGRTEALKNVCANLAATGVLTCEDLQDFKRKGSNAEACFDWFGDSVCVCVRALTKSGIPAAKACIILVFTWRLRRLVTSRGFQESHTRDLAGNHDQEHRSSCVLLRRNGSIFILVASGALLPFSIVKISYKN